MNGNEAAIHLLEAARHWAAIASTRRAIAQNLGDTLEALGQLLAAAEGLERSREKINEAIDLWGKDGRESSDDNVREADALASEVDAAREDLDSAFGNAVTQVVKTLESDGEVDDLLEARELAALNHERLAAGKGLAELTDLLPGGGCGGNCGCR